MGRWDRMRMMLGGWLVIVGMACGFGIGKAEVPGSAALVQRLESLKEMDEKRLLAFTARFKGLVEKADFKAGAEGQASLASCRMVAGALLDVLGEKKLAAGDARTVAIAEATRVFLAKAEARMDDCLAAMVVVVDVAPPSGPTSEPRRVYPNALEQAMLRMEHQRKIADHRVWSDHRALQEGLGRAWMDVLFKVSALPLPRETMVGMFTTEKSMSRRALVQILDRRERVLRGGR